MLTLIGEIKKLPVRKANRIVIAELMEMPGCAETLIVSDTEEDFVPVKWAMTDSTVKRPVSEAISCASCAFRGFPIRVVTISHSKMTEQEAYSVIMGKNVDIPPKKVLEKRDLQYLYWDENDEWKKTHGKALAERVRVRRAALGRKRIGFQHPVISYNYCSVKQTEDVFA